MTMERLTKSEKKRCVTNGSTSLVLILLEYKRIIENSNTTSDRFTSIVEGMRSFVKWWPYENFKETEKKLDVEKCTSLVLFPLTFALIRI